MSIDISTASTAVLAFDRAHVAEAKLFAQKLGRGWKLGVDTWLNLPGMPYLLLVAHNKLRVLKAAPLIMVAKDLPTLRESARMACQHLNEVKCAWLFFLEDEPQQIVQAEALHDAVAGGRA